MKIHCCTRNMVLKKKAFQKRMFKIPVTFVIFGTIAADQRTTPTMTKLIRIITVLLILLMGAGKGQPASAQSTLSDPGPIPCEPNPFNDCPIDSGLSLLLGAGVVYGFLRYRNSPVKENEEATTGVGEQ